MQREKQTDDLISRQAAIDALDEIESEVADGDGFQYEKWRKYFTELPPAPECKTGKWIDGKRMKFDGTFYWFRQCDQCGYERNDCDTEKDSNFCPDCGADMREGQDER